MHNSEVVHNEFQDLLPKEKETEELKEDFHIQCEPSS